MNPNTHAIAHFETESDAEAAGYTVPLTDKDALLLSVMNRHDRRNWLSEKRKQRNAAKRKRKARRARKQR